MATGKPTLVGARVDWLDMAFRVSLGDHAVRMLRAAAAFALRDQSPSDVVLGARWLKMHPPRMATRWLLQDDVSRVTVDEKAPGGEGDAPGWTVRIETSGTALLALGYRRAIAEAWKLAGELGVIEESRFGRTDVCADVAGYELREVDRHAFVKQRRVSSSDMWRDGKPVVRRGKGGRRKTDGTIEKEKESVGWQTSMVHLGKADDDSHTVALFGGDTFTGFTFGSRKTVSARIYDKRLQLRTQVPEKAAAEESWWKAGGWDGSADVARVEFEFRGEALDELGIRHAVRGDVGGAAHAEKFAAGLDGLWAYATQLWLRLERRGEGAVQPRWRAVQGATFERAAAPTVRVRQRGLAKAAQARGAAMSFLARIGEFPAQRWPGRVTCDGEVDTQARGLDADALVSRFVGRAATPEAGHAKAAAELRRSIVELCALAAERITDAELEKFPTGSDALRAHWTRCKATLARCSPAPAWYEEQTG